MYRRRAGLWIDPSGSWPQARRPSFMFPNIELCGSPPPLHPVLSFPLSFFIFTDSFFINQILQGKDVVFSLLLGVLLGLSVNFLLHLSFSTLTFWNVCFWLTLLHLVAAWLLFCSCYCIGTLIWFFSSLHDLLHLVTVPISTSLFCYFISLHLVFWLILMCNVVALMLFCSYSYIGILSFLVSFILRHLALSKCYSRYCILSLQLSLHFVITSTFILSLFFCCIIVFVFWLTLQLLILIWLFLYHHH